MQKRDKPITKPFWDSFRNLVSPYFVFLLDFFHKFITIGHPLHLSVGFANF